MRIAIDAMGGDHAPGQIVQGALQAAAEWPDTTLLLVGDQAQIEPLLAGKKLANVEIVHTDEVIGPDDEPVRAVRRKKGSSMVVCGTLVKEGKADAMLSAGNTGALMATGLLVVGRIDGIDRPALAPMLPTMDDVGVLALDLGANMDASPEHLQQYAIMGSIFRQKVNGMDRPRVGLLNVGTEAKKGNELTKAAYDKLEQAPIHFIGNVEARDVLLSNCDVLICDGFAGNILLKAMEGTAGVLMRSIRDTFMSSLLGKIAGAIVRPKLQGLRSKMDYKEYGGAPLLGLKGLVLKGHGSSNDRAIKNAVGKARIAIKNKLVEAIQSEFSGK